MARMSVNNNRKSDEVTEGISAFIRSGVRYELEKFIGDLKYDFDGNCIKGGAVLDFVEHQFDINLDNEREWFEREIEKEGES